MSERRYNPAAFGNGLDPAAWSPGYAPDNLYDDDPFSGAGAATVSFDAPYQDDAADV